MLERRLLRIHPVRTQVQAIRHPVIPVLPDRVHIALVLILRVPILLKVRLIQVLVIVQAVIHRRENKKCFFIVTTN